MNPLVNFAEGPRVDNTELAEESIDWKSERDSERKNKKKEKSAPVESPVDELLNQLSKKTREADVLNNLMNTLRGQVSKLQIERDDLSNKLSEFEKQLARAQSIESSTQAEELEVLKQRLRESDDEIVSLKEKLESFDVERTKFQDQAVILQNKIDSFESEISKKSEDGLQLQSEMDQLTEKLNSASVDLSLLRVTISEKETQLESHKTLIESLNETISSLKNELTESAAFSNEKLVALTQTVQVLSANDSINQQKLTDALIALEESEKTSLSKERHFSEQVSQLVNRAELAENAARELSDDNNRMRDTFARQESEIKNISLRLSSSVAECASVAQTASILKKEAENAAIDAERSKLRAIKIEDDFARKIASLETDLARSKSIESQLRDEIEGLIEQQTRAMDAVTNAHKQKEKMELGLTEEASKTKTLEKKTKLNEKKIKELEDKIEADKQSLMALNSKLTEAEAQSRNFQVQIEKTSAIHKTQLYAVAGAVIVAMLAIVKVVGLRFVC